MTSAAGAGPVGVHVALQGVARYAGLARRLGPFREPEVFNSLLWTDRRAPRIKMDGPPQLASTRRGRGVMQEYE